MTRVSQQLAQKAVRDDLDKLLREYQALVSSLHAQSALIDQLSDRLTVLETKRGPGRPKRLE